MKQILFFAGIALVAATFAVSEARAQSNAYGQLPVTSFAKPYLFLIRDPAVHADLKVNARQQQQLDALNDELDVSIMSMRNKSTKHINDVLNKGTETVKKRLTSILTTVQRKRLDEIQMWVWGMKSFLQDSVAQRLKLTADQRTKINDTITSTQKSISELEKRLKAGESSTALNKEARELRTKEQKDILAVLSRQQQQQWIAMIGKRIDVSKLGRVKFKAPELQGKEWINSAPVSLRQLKGKVVALHFYAFA